MPRSILTCLLCTVGTESALLFLPNRIYSLITTLKTQLWAAISMLMPQTHYNRHGSVFNRFSSINFIHLARSSYPQLMIARVLRDRKPLSLMWVAPCESTRIGGPWSSGPCATPAGPPTSALVWPTDHLHTLLLQRVKSSPPTGASLLRGKAFL